jgi:hypothetical protein
MSALADRLLTKAKALQSGIGFFSMGEGVHPETEMSVEVHAILQNAAGA